MLAQLLSRVGQEVIRLYAATRLDSVAVFPEGALSPCPGSFHPPHTGIARLALNAEVTVIPVGIDLDYRRVLSITPEIDGQVVPGRLYLRGRYAMTVGQPMWFHGSGQDRRLARSVAAQIMWHIGELAHESARRRTRRQVPVQSVVWPAPAISLA